MNTRLNHQPDTQLDMLMALIGAISAQVLQGKAQDAQLERGVQ